MDKSFSLKHTIKQFFESSFAGGIILLLCVVLSLCIANSTWGEGFEHLLGSEWGVHTESLHLRYSLLLWINDGLMAIFFLLVGLEIKRELVSGQLSSPKKAALPIIAALGGVLVPAGIYAVFNSGTDTAGGWGIPMATDIAFAIGIITMLGDRVPLSLKVFLAALAIVDDLMAILVIAIFYSSGISWAYLGTAGGILALLILFNRLGISNLLAYLIPGVFIWYFIHHSGVHATVAGVLVAMCIPMQAKGKSSSPLIDLEHALSKPVTFLIMPLFALANTNIRFQGEMIEGLGTPLGLGILFGLILGKPLGISLISWISIKLGLCVMPEKSNIKQLTGVGMLAGIGFTMSIFIALLSFPGNELLGAEAKFAILCASLVSGLIGSLTLISIAKKTQRKEKPRP